jgi:hypothetical protein
MISPEKEILGVWTDGGGEEERRRRSRRKVNDDECVWLAGGMALFPSVLVPMSNHE